MRFSQILKLFYCFLWLILVPIRPAYAIDIEPIECTLSRPAWVPTPYIPGPGTLEREIIYEYGAENFPENPLHGEVTIPVFLVDFEDLTPNPRTDSEQTYTYQQTTPEETSWYVNHPIIGIPAYFNDSSGGQFNVQAKVFDWFSSATSSYLKPLSHYESLDDPDRALAADVLAAAYVEHGINLTEFDSDRNRIIDGFVIVIEGEYVPGAFGSFRAAMHSTVSTCYDTRTLVFDRLSAIVPAPPEDDILFSRHVIQPEYTSNDYEQVTPIGTGAHELGHLFLGFSDHYHGIFGWRRYTETFNLRNSALSSSAGRQLIPGTGEYVPVPISGMEKRLFGNWIEPLESASTGNYTLVTHMLSFGERYQPDRNYVHTFPLNADGTHYLSLEYRKFRPLAESGSFYTDNHYLSQSQGPQDLESGVLIFEVDENKPDGFNISIKRPVRNLLSDTQVAFQKGDTFRFCKDDLSSCYQLTISQTGLQTASYSINQNDSVPYEMLAEVLKYRTNLERIVTFYKTHPTSTFQERLEANISMYSLEQQSYAIGYLATNASLKILKRKQPDCGSELTALFDEFYQAADDLDSCYSECRDTATEALVKLERARSAIQPIENTLRAYFPRWRPPVRPRYRVAPRPSFSTS